MLVISRVSTTVLLVLGVLAFATAPAVAELSTPNLFGNHMVLQRDAPAPLWGRATPDAEVTVTLTGGANQTHTVTAAEDGRWRVVLEPLSPGEPLTVTISGDGKLEFRDVVVGEVWVCSGQSNMKWAVNRSMNGELDLLTADRPNLRLLTVPGSGSQTPRDDFQGQWERCTPAAAGPFSAIGYHFGRRLVDVLDVPVGLIDNAWGGSAAEAWTPRERLEADERFATAAKKWQQRDAQSDVAQQTEQNEKSMKNWRRRADQSIAKGQRPPEIPQGRGWLFGNQRPGNLYQARVAPIAGYAVRGVIWYQGESNQDRAAMYNVLFPLMIESWRDAWGQEKLPFYWVQLADYLAVHPNPTDSKWARVREAQTKTLDRLPDTGQAVIIDLGEGNDIHPRNKQEVANRLARIALAKDYGYQLRYQSPRLKSMEVVNGKAILTLAPFGSGLKVVDSDQIVGFAICGADKKWQWAKAKLVDKGKTGQVEVWHPQIAEPVAVRYAWADNPEANLFTGERLPVTPFRTDDW